MRLLIESMAAVTLIAVFGIVIVDRREQEQSEADAQFVASALDRLHEVTDYRTALAVAEAAPGEATAVVAIRPEWFGESLPTNVLVEQNQPWIDIAPPGDRSSHPPRPRVGS